MTEKESKRLEKIEEYASSIDTNTSEIGDIRIILDDILEEMKKINVNLKNIKDNTRS